MTCAHARISYYFVVRDVIKRKLYPNYYQITDTVAKSTCVVFQAK